ncbi:MAG TPA: biopolymer transporter ExbD [Myxococcota bacterium]|jgi:biopolymer transport protein ExbD|nr:biopolymer transporter ExbD [Myxococcota bacterium]
MGVSVETKGGKRSLDAELNLVPFIDLLSSCIAFLLMTAVWTSMYRMDATNKNSGTSGTAEKPDSKPLDRLVLVVDPRGYTVIAGKEKYLIPKKGESYDIAELDKKLKQVKGYYPDRLDMNVAVASGVLFADITAAMDTSIGQGFTDVSLTDATGVI